MKSLFRIIALAGLLCSNPAAANEIRLLGKPTQGCKTLGIVKAYIKPDLPLFTPRYILGDELFKELKTKAAKLGANRLVIRHTVDEKIYQTQGPTLWVASTYVAEAFRC